MTIRTGLAPLLKNQRLTNNASKSCLDRTTPLMRKSGTFKKTFVFLQDNWESSKTNFVKFATRMNNTRRS